VCVEKVPQLMLVAVRGSGYKQARVPDAAVHRYFGGLLFMMGHHSRSESLFYYFRLEDQVPDDACIRRSDLRPQYMSPDAWRDLERRSTRICNQRSGS
jgi:hypothetical protein